jgi:cyclomaltodextrinase
LVESTLVRLRCRPDVPATSLELRGELPHWAAPVTMAPAGHGCFEAALRVAPGVYEYKLSLPGGTWRLDPGNPRTRAHAGVRNNLLVVDGTDEPVLHAPSAPWLERGATGTLIVRAALRREAGTSLAVRYDEGPGDRQALMRVVGEEDEHRLFEVELPGSGKQLEYLFVLADGRLVGRGGGAALSGRARPARLPAWWPDAVVYSIFVDRFRRGGEGGAWHEPARTDREHRAGGDLDGVREALPYLCDLGVTALHLTPFTHAASPHRYDTIDPFRVDPALGGAAALERLLEDAGALGLRVIMDVPVTHLHVDHDAFRDVAARGPESPYFPWFRVKRWPFFAGPEPGYEHYQKGQWREPLLELGDAAVQEHLERVLAHWAGRGVHGFRIDAAADLPLELCARLTAAVKRVRPDALVFGEVVPQNLERWTGSGALDAATDFAVPERVHRWLAGEASASTVAAEAARLRFRRGSEAGRRVGFSASHDQPRLRSRLATPDAAPLGQLLVLLGAAVPMIYYGDEIGLRSEAAEARDFEDSWPDRQCFPWPRAGWDAPTFELTRAAIALRRRHAVLRLGDETLGAAEGAADVLLLRRQLGREVVDVLLNRSGETHTVALPAAAPDARAAVLLVHGDAALVDDTVTGAAQVRLGAHAAIVLERTPAPAEPLLREANPWLAARAFRDGLTTSPAYPTRLYVTVTERCNLRCAHCITSAPQLTASGRARQLRPWLLDALAEPFAHADYVAFTHGGESLTAAIFPEVLRRLQAARAGRPGRADVHLVSNGMLLDGERVRRLIDLGLTSLMVSLDGAQAATNDRVRVGGSFTQVVAHVREALRLRRSLGADLRLGLSTVIGRGNAHEVDALAELAIDLGVDWLKLEETYPCTPFARLDRLPPDDARLRRAVADAAIRLRDAGVVLVDHLDPPAACPCHGDAAARAFRAADDFANRTTFAPCRMAWEQACIDPDGTVRAVDHAQPALGSLLRAELLALWNGPLAQRLRAQALAATTPASRARCVGAD